jgi:predicted dehydrogenase
MIKMEKIKAAIIGLGRIASLLEEDALREKPCTHAGAITADSDCVLVCGCDTDKDRRLLFAEKWQVPVFENAQEMLTAHSPQILVIATHPDSHYLYCRLAYEYKIPVVICEKPLANNLKDSRKIARLVSHNEQTIVVNHERRYSNDYASVKSILNVGKLGNILRIRAVLYMGKTTRLLDMLWHDGTHLVDAIMFLTDAELKYRRKWGSKRNSRSGTAWLEGTLTRGENAPIPVIIETGAGRDHLVFEIEFSCEKGRITMGNGVFEVKESLPSPYAEKFRSLKNTGEEFNGKTLYFTNMLKDACLCARDTNHKPLSSAQDALKVIEYLHSVKPWRRY